MRVEIYRHYQDKNQTSGVCIIFDDEGFPLFSALSLERGWQDNKPNISCVPAGAYTLKYEYSERFKKHLWELKNVTGRTECKFHSANYWYQLNGCISLGLKYKDLNRDNYRDVTNSTNTMKAFESVLNGMKEVELIIY